MSDRIEGIAVIDRHRLDNGEIGEVLNFVAVRANGDRPPFVSHIPVAAKGVPAPTRWGEDHVWRYEELSPGMIEVRPSVLMKYQRQHDPGGTPLPKEQWEWVEYFHNDGIWSVRYVRLEEGEEFEAYRKVREMNADLLERPPAPVAQPAPAAPPQSSRPTGGVTAKPSAGDPLARVRFSPRLDRR